jgi:hypothetical protein
MRLGVELETEFNTSDYSLFDKGMKILREQLGKFCIFKHDGSLGTLGVEIVSLPFLLEEHVKMVKGEPQGLWEHFLTHLPPKLNSWNGGRCGIHIHISRKPLSLLQIGKMIVFLNHPNNAAFITTIAGRYGSGYSKLKKKTIKDVTSGDKYEMLNLMHPNTVELRIFRGTLNKEHFYSNLEFAVALTHFCKEASIKNLNGDAMIEFVKTRHKDYPFLFNWFLKKKLSTDVDESGEI